MLKPAYPYREELQKTYEKILFNPKYKYWSYNCYWNNELNLAKNSYDAMEFVSLDRQENIIGFFYAEIDRVTNSITSLGVMNFLDELNLTFSKDLGIFLTNLFDVYNFRKIHFSVVVGNPAEKMYDKIIKKYNGKIVGIFKDHTMLEDGKLYDVKHYEIFKDDYNEKKSVANDFTNNKMTLDEWIKDKYKNEFIDVGYDFLSQSPVKQINNLDDLVNYLDWNYRNCNGEYSTNCTLACEIINYRNYQNK